MCVTAFIDTCDPVNTKGMSRLEEIIKQVRVHQTASDRDKHIFNLLHPTDYVMHQPV